MTLPESALREFERSTAMAWDDGVPIDKCGPRETSGD
jgi:hypothetical protein